MSAPHTAEWYLEVGGKKSGPYSTAQVLELAQSGQLQPHHRVTAAHLGEQWITVDELARSMGPESFHPPPRPSTLQEKQQSYSPPAGAGGGDPMLGLFDALQAAKDR